jgi:hypothetical protein
MEPGEVDSDEPTGIAESLLSLSGYWIQGE